MTLQPAISAISVPTSRNAIYNSTGCEASCVELFVCAPEEWRHKDEDRHLEDLYQEGISSRLDHTDLLLATPCSQARISAYVI